VEHEVLAEELAVLDADSSLWPAARPLLDIALRLEQNDDSYSWHGWNKEQISRFLKSLPTSCSLIIGVWEIGETEGDPIGQENLTLGVICEVVEGEISSVRTFEALVAEGLKPIKQLEPGFEDALEIMRLARIQVAPVAWALFTDKATWDEWLFADGENETVIDKGELLATFARQGRCVLMGNQATHHPR
jgi:hypothetical protein